MTGPYIFNAAAGSPAEPLLGLGTPAVAGVTSALPEALDLSDAISGLTATAVLETANGAFAAGFVVDWASRRVGRRNMGHLLARASKACALATDIIVIGMSARNQEHVARGPGEHVPHASRNQT